MSTVLSYALGYLIALFRPGTIVRVAPEAIFVLKLENMS